MNIYLWALAAISAGALLENRIHSKRSRTVYIIFCGAVLMLVMGCRSENIGADLIMYRNAYNIYGEGPWSDVLENSNYGYFALGKLHFMLFHSYQLWLSMISVFAMGMVTLLILRCSNYPYLSFVLYMALGFYDFAFSGLKQIMAMSFLIPAFFALMKRKPLRFLLFVAIAGTMHQPAFVFLPAYLIARRRLTYKYFIVLVIGIILIFIVRYDIVSWLGSLYDEAVYNEAVGLGGKAVMVLFMIALAILFLTPTGENPRQLVLFNLLVVAFVLQTFSVYSHNFNRLAFYYFQFSVVYLPQLFTKPVPGEPQSRHLLGFPPGTTRLANAALTVFALFYLWDWMSCYGPTALLPYQAFWQM